MNLLSEKLDIINIFKMMCLGKEVKQKYKFDKSMIHLSKECINSLKKIKIKQLYILIIYHYLYNSKKLKKN